MTLASRRRALESAMESADLSLTIAKERLETAHGNARVIAAAIADHDAWAGATKAHREVCLAMTREEMEAVRTMDLPALDAAGWPEERGLIATSNRRSGGRFNMSVGRNRNYTRAGLAACALAKRGVAWFTEES